MEQNGNGFNNGYQQDNYQQNNYQQNNYQQSDYQQNDYGQSYNQQSMTNLPYNGNPNSFRPQINPAGQADYGYQQNGMNPSANMPAGGKKLSKNKKADAKSMKLQDTAGGKKKGKAGIIAAVIAVLLLAAGAGTYFLFFTPEKRLDRRLTEGADFFAQQDYEQSAEAYEQALDIDGDNLTAMRGVLQAYSAMNDTGSMREAFESYREIISGLSQEEKDENQNILTDIYMMAELVYPDDTEACVAALKEGMDETGQSERIKNKLVDIYLKQAVSFDESGDYDEAISFYASVLELDASNESALSGRRDCIKDSLDEMLEAADYESAQEMIDTYNGVVDLNFTEYTQRIEKLKTLAEEGTELMEQVIACMSAGDYNGMAEVYNSQAAVTVAELMDGTSYIYASDGFTSDYTGTAAGLYMTEYQGHYFYYGEYADGKRQGHGVLYVLKDADTGYYELYEGEWKDNKPNGSGAVIQANEENGGEILTQSMTGNFTNGYMDGEITATISSSEGYTVTGSFTADMGVAPDIKDQYPDKEFEVPENRVVYVVLTNEAQDVWWYISRNEKAVLTAFGF